MSPPKLLSTLDYSRFDLCQFNRNVQKTRHLRDSMKRHGFIPAYPIHCEVLGSRLLIKAGHHRFEVAQDLGLPVYYVISNDVATIHELEKATTRWSVTDYLESHVKCGKPDYIVLQNYFHETGIPLGLCIAILGGESAGSGNKLQEFKDGRFVVRGEQHAKDIKSVVMPCRALGIAINEMFVSSLSRCLRVPEFSIDTFLTRARSNISAFRKCRTLKEQMQLFEDVYNYKAHLENKLALCFLADKAMAARTIAALKQSQQAS